MSKPQQDDHAEVRDANGKIINHRAATRRQSRQQQEFPDDFDERAKANAQRVTKIHEFRRENIKEMEAPTKDYFEYDPNEKNRYDALKLENLFKFQNTYKAIKWGVMVGGMFAFHRYYRTRDLNAAAHWFTVMSFASFFNIWLSYGIQEFVTDYGSRKNVSLSSRNEYHMGAYKAYVERQENTIKSLDDQYGPVINNITGQAINTFVDEFDKHLIERFQTQDIKDGSEFYNAMIFKNWKKEEGENQTNSQLLQLHMITKDKYKRESIEMDDAALRAYAKDVLDRVDAVDLKSYEFDKILT